MFASGLALSHESELYVISDLAPAVNPCVSSDRPQTHSLNVLQLENLLCKIYSSSSALTGLDIHEIQQLKVNRPAFINPKAGESLSNSLPKV